MLEGAILDNTERLLAQSPYFSAVPKHTYMHLEASGTSKYDQAALLAGLYLHGLDIFLFQGGDSGHPLYRLIPENYAQGLATVVQDYASPLHYLTEEPGTGRVWAVLNDSSGNDGLYLRSNSIGTPNWTKILGSASGATLKIWRLVTGVLWFNDATAGNWYRLSNGAIGGGTVTPPSGLYTSAIADERYCNVDFIAAYSGSSWYSSPGGSNIFMSVTPVAEGSTIWQTHPGFLFDNGAAPSQPTIRAFIPNEFAASAFAPYSVSSNFLTGSFRLDETYTLLTIVSKFKDTNAATPSGASYLRQFSGDKGYVRISFALLNRSSWVCKFLGVAYLPVLLEQFTATDAATWNIPQILGARMKASNLDIFWANQIRRTPAANQTGIAWSQIPLSKLDF